MIAARLRFFAAIVGVAVIAGGLWLAYGRGVLAERDRWEKAQASEAVDRAAQQNANDDETARRLTKQKEIAENAIRERDAARVAAVGAGAAGERLRAQVRHLTMSLAARDPRPAGSGATAGDTIDLLADVQRRSDEATDAIARYADEAGAAGRACQASYDALSSAR